MEKQPSRLLDYYAFAHGQSEDFCEDRGMEFKKQNGYRGGNDNCRDTDGTLFLIQYDYDRNMVEPLGWMYR